MSNSSDILSILLVEDNEYSLAILKEMIRRNLQLNIFHCSKGTDVFDILENQKIDLILMDIYLPNFNGFEIAKRIRQNPITQNLPIIFITAEDPNKDLEKNAYELGGVDYLTKPFEENELVRLIKLYFRFLKREREVNAIVELNNQKLQQEIQERRTTQEALALSEKMLKKANASKDTFFSIISHDLRGPLGYFQSVTDLVFNDWNNLSQDEIYDFIKELNDSSKQVYALVENLLNWANSQTGNISFESREQFVDKVINSVLDLMNPIAKRKNITLHCENLAQQRAYFDFNSVQTVVRNLINNAIKFTPENGEIRIKLEDNENYLKILISDNGVGISPDKIDKLFSIEEKTSTKGTNNEAGSGLGLILCSEFILRNKGTISVQSVYGKGSTFVIEIPKFEMN